jgi:tetratricopeptide (TPR) repeat protein
MSILLALLAQVGPFVTPGPQPASPLPPEIIERKQQEQEKRQRQRQPPPTATPQPSRSPGELDNCLAGVSADPLAAVDAAQAWLAKAKGPEAAQAGHCLGVAFGRLERWDEARAAFLQARDASGVGVERARLGAMAGNAALAGGDAQAALAVLDVAHADAEAANDKPLAGDIAIDRARALVALGRDGDAASALAEARAALPANPQAWLLSATLSRRMGKLAEAQAEIEKAAELLPIDPEIGLEAGVIAMLSGREEAARKSWQSVIDAAPKSEAATTARGYLAQLGEGSTAKP